MKKSLYINPEIKKFWEASGNVVLPVFPINNKDYYKIWDCYNNTSGFQNYDYAIINLDGEDIYSFDGVSYSEEEMLRIIKLKAFV